MNKKVIITIICALVVILVCFFIGIILSDKNVDNNVNNIEKENKKEENNVEKTEEEITNKAKNVVLNSKIGNEIRNQIKVANIYSKYFFDEIGKNGLTDKSKLIFTFSRITGDSSYSNLIRYSEKYADGYITSDDLKVVLKKIFNNSDNIKDMSLFEEGSFDKEDENYVIVPMGFVNYSYVVDVAYKIDEYDDKVEVFSYRLYVNTNNMESETGEELVKNILYYDINKQNIALETEDIRMNDQDTQDEFILENIDSMKLNKNKLKTVKYTLIKKNSSYLIDNIE